MSEIRGSAVATAALLLAGALLNTLIVATASTPPSWGWARLLFALALAGAAIGLVRGELSTTDRSA